MAARAMVHVRPLLSTSTSEARRRVFNLYRAWWREVPHIVTDYKLDITIKQGRDKVRELFMRNANVTDLRIMDMLVIKGKMELEETHYRWKAKTHVMRHFEQTKPIRPRDFLSKFLDGHNN